MGVDTKLIIDSRWEIDEVITVIERVFKTKVEKMPTSFGNYQTLHFELEGDVKRMLSAHTSYQHNGFTGTLLSLGASGKAYEVLKAVAEVFGGYLQKFDYDEQYEGFRGKLYDGDGLIFWVKRAIINGIDHKDHKALGKFTDKTKGDWQK